jgi:hypothetical protein
MSKPFSYRYISSKYQKNDYVRKPRSYSFSEGDIIKSKRLVGVELEAGREPYPYSKMDGDERHKMITEGHKNADLFYKNLFKIDRNIGASTDAGGIEIQTPPKAGKKLERIVSLSCAFLKENEFYSTDYCGTHIHIDANDFAKKGKVDADKIANLITFYHAIEPITVSFIPKYRRNGGYCYNISSMSSDTFKFGSQFKSCIMYLKDAIEGDKPLDYIRNRTFPSKFYGVNLNYLFEKNKHIEIRYLHGTLEPMDILHWANLHTSIFDAISTNKFGDSLNELLVDIKRTLGGKEDNEIQNAFNLLSQEIGLSKDTVEYLDSLREKMISSKSVGGRPDNPLRPNNT